MGNPQYCPGNTSLIPVWVDNGISPCFQATIVSILLFIILMAGVVQILLFQRRTVKVEERFRVRPLWFRLQVGLTFLMVVQYGVWMIVLGVLGKTIIIPFCKKCEWFFTLLMTYLDSVTLTTPNPSNSNCWLCCILLDTVLYSPYREGYFTWAGCPNTIQQQGVIAWCWILVDSRRFLAKTIRDFKLKLSQDGLLTYY